mmetsp:Transcript_19327/g.63849  ORF Transcript_19327/g.63849 Transcript_19327/m.63849 type:complete len:183 (-) Transcript_19327:37-585(-)|eukprot:CAMPEP_0196673916 /NCGR_PEP_ID=MMETSP1090-20130531/3222_1 /TAXON_ID=37098 /ORGANISM="Isochrysis sp, Strain CCMP1244" /LENGTH=182 /DNA_ID=CAMNT_0042011697 /DNA_START=76 /DNA_END=624 /DNA_ORIENTATION=+
MSASTEQIPVATFIDDIDKYMVKEGSAEAALEKLQAFYSACKAIEQRMSQRKKRLQAKVPDIESTYNALLQMQQRAEQGESLTVHYELAQCVYAKAIVPVHRENKVCLWLGANVMLEYGREEAIELLERNLAEAKKTLQELHEDQALLRDQITTTEVNMARVFNWDVKERRKAKAAEASEAQ